MKIRKLRLQNINSIYGTWDIDFQDDAYLNSPLFAIVGKTGSGKTTILDAISFALYDRTDRMGDKRAAFVSYNTNECMAELEFELNGTIYISHTSITRNKKDEFTDSVSGSWIQWDNEKIDGTSRKCAKVKELLGLNFDQFRQVILLAQGKFNAFLTEKPEMRAEILENITGTEIYSRIGNKISEMSKDCLENYKDITKELSLIKLMSAEDEENNNLRLAEIESEEKKAKGKIKELDGYFAAAQALQAAEDSLKNLAIAEGKLQEDEAVFAQMRPRLEAGRTAARVSAEYNAFDAIRKEQERDRKTLEESQVELPELQKAYVEAKRISDENTESLEKISTNKQEREIFLSGIDTIDNEIIRLRKEITGSEKKSLSIGQEIDKYSKAISLLRKEIEGLKNAREQAVTYLQMHMQDADLAVKSVEWSASYTELCSDRNELEKQKCKLEEERKRLTAAEKRVEDTNRDLQEKTEAKENVRKSSEAAEEALKSALNGHSLEALEVAQNKQQEIVSILKALKPHEVLKTFQEGSPCPVCGAIHHPYREEQFAESPELIAAEVKLAHEQKVYQIAKKASDTAVQESIALTKAEGEMNIAQAQAKTAQDFAMEKKNAIETFVREFTAKEQAMFERCRKLQQNLSDYGFLWDGQNALPVEIQKRQQEYASQKSLADDFEKNQAALKTKMAGMQGELNGRETALKEENEQLASRNKQLGELKEKRRAEYQDKQTSDERLVLQRGYDDALRLKDDASKCFVKAKADVDHADTKIKTLVTQIAGREKEYSVKEQAFKSALLLNGLSEKEYLAALLEQKEFDRLVTEETNLKTRQEHIRQERKKQTENADASRAKLPVDFDVAKAKDSKDTLLESSSKLAEERGGITQMLLDNQDKLKKVAGLQKKLEDNKAEWNRWERLDGWLGGKRFMRLAQAYTFETLLTKANEQLRNMLNGRYQMCSYNEEDKLEIYVLDNQLGGDVRTSKNLSGGEQFVISMSLALGLASMVGEKFHVDSLFLDEGFGTLDGDELEKAMDTLAQLKSDGKLVGIITHAERLHERIVTHITLDKHGNGRSYLDGPGVKLIEQPEMFVSREEKQKLKEQEKLAKKAQKEQERLAKKMLKSTT